MVLYAALDAGLDYETAMTLPLSLVEDIIATHQIMTMGYDRVLTDPRDIEADFVKMMSAR